MRRKFFAALIAIAAIGGVAAPVIATSAPAAVAGTHHVISNGTFHFE